LLAIPANAKQPQVKVRDSAYSARFVSQSEPDPIKIEAGTTKTITIKFKNSGTATWDNAGSRFISAYTMEPRYHDSMFAGGNWISKKQTAKISGTVKPGETGTLKVQLTAPEKVGEYTERFYLASENYTWVDNGYFFLKINVTEKTIKKAIVEIEPTVVVKAEEVVIEKVVDDKVKKEYKAKNVGQNYTDISVEGGQKIKMIVLFQNTGETKWEEHAIFANTPEVSGLSFADDSWHEEDLVYTKAEEKLPGQTIRGEFYFRAPSEVGNYTAMFSLNVNQEDVPGVFAEVEINVTSSASSNYNKPTFNASPEPVESVRLDAEPRIRVGMEQPMDFVQFKSEENDYRVIVAGEEIGVLTKNHLGVFKFDGTYYYFKGADVDYEGPAYVRLEPIEGPRGIFTLLNYQRKVKWKGPNNFNIYRGAFEYRQGKVDKKLYAINDLLMEDYVAGIAETSNVSDIDYIKALLVAARTYAYDAKEKYPFFDVLGNTYDQLYLGYESERLMSRVVQAQKETRGYMVTYNGEIVVTPYFANSTGMTKSWKQVWGGRTAHPWLVPVEAKYDKGQPMRGHGVGMSARDAAVRADEEGVSWIELLKHYYTGVEVEKIYN